MKTSLELAGMQAVEMTRRNQAKKEFIFRCAMQSNAAVEREAEEYRQSRIVEYKRDVKDMLFAVVFAALGIAVVIGLVAVL